MLLADGAIGTELVKFNPSKSDFPDEKQGFSDGLSLTHPEWIKQIHQSYVEAGADCLTTNTFGSSVIKLAEYGYDDKTESLNEDAVELARACGNNDTLVLGSMGPSGYLPSLPVDSDKIDHIKESYFRQAVGLKAADMIILETGSDILELKLAIRAIKKAVPSQKIIASVTLANADSLITGTSVETACMILSKMSIDMFGINCSTGPAEMITALGKIPSHTRMMISPNAGIPDISNQGVYPLQSEEMSNVIQKIIMKFKNIEIIGGCCGTTPAHIAKLRKLIPREH